MGASSTKLERRAGSCALAWLPCALLLGSCSSPPRPPTVEESNRRPANNVQAVELQGCRSELHHTRLLAGEASRAAEAAAWTAARLHQQQVGAAASCAAAQGSRAASAANQVFTLHFDFGVTRPIVAQAQVEPMLVAARASPLVMLRARTDGSTDAPVESRVARERAAAVRAMLVAGGVPPQRIRETFQPSGDHVADNSTPDGRSRNRRVEVEVYQALPQSVDAAAMATP